MAQVFFMFFILQIKMVYFRFFYFKKGSKNMDQNVILLNTHQPKVTGNSCLGDLNASHFTLWWILWIWCVEQIWSYSCGMTSLFRFRSHGTARPGNCFPHLFRHTKIGKVEKFQGRNPNVLMTLIWPQSPSG